MIFSKLSTSICLFTTQHYCTSVVVNTALCVQQPSIPKIKICYGNLDLLIPSLPFISCQVAKESTTAHCDKEQDHPKVLFVLLNKDLTINLVIRIA